MQIEYVVISELCVCTSACFPIHCSNRKPRVVLRVSRPKINCRPIPQSKVCQDHCNTDVHTIKSLFTWVCVCLCVCACLCAFPLLTLNGCLENNIIKKVRSSKPQKDTSCLFPRCAVSSTNQHTTATSSSTYTILERDSLYICMMCNIWTKWRQVCWQLKK